MVSRSKIAGVKDNYVLLSWRFSFSFSKTP